MPTPDRIEFLRTTDLFREVAPDALERLAGELTEISLRHGEALIRQGDLDTNLYLVLEGTLRLASGPANASRVLFDVQPGESVAEMAVVSSEPSAVSIEAAASTRVVSLSRTAFDRFAIAFPNDAQAMLQAMSERMQRYRLSVALHLSHLFDDLRPDVLRDLESELEVFTLSGGEVLFLQGDPGDYLCLIVSGRVSVLLEPEPGRETVVTELGSGELVGEMAVVSNQIRTATVEATRDTQLAKLTKDAYLRFLTKHPESAVQMVSHKLAERLRETTSGRTWQPRTVSTFAVLPIHAAAPKSDVSERLAKALSEFGSTLRLTSQSVDAHLGRAGIAQTYEREGSNIRLVEWLNRQELEHTYLIYEADSAPSPWTERCIRQADHIVLVADGGADPVPSEMETALQQHLAGRRAARPSLILVHENGDPSGTGRWLTRVVWRVISTCAVATTPPWNEWHEPLPDAPWV
jgi:lysophospholipid hydrolase